MISCRIFSINVEVTAIFWRWMCVCVAKSNKKQLKLLAKMSSRQMNSFIGQLIVVFASSCRCLTLSQVDIWFYFTAAMWRNLPSKSPQRWMNSFYSIMTFDLKSNQFIHRLVHHCLYIFVLTPYSITGMHSVTFRCSKVVKSHLKDQ